MVATEHRAAAAPAQALRAPTLLIFAATALVAALPAQAEDKIGYQTYKYVEAGDRMSVVAGDLSIEKDFGTDHVLSLDVGHDAISGATPCWQLKPGYANEYASGKCSVANEVRHSLGGSWLSRDAQRNEYTFGAALSREPDFYSKELSAQALYWQDESHNRSYIAGVALQHNTSIATAATNNAVNEHNSAVNLQFGVNQVVDRSSTVELAAFAARDSGYLSNHYLQIVRTDSAGMHYLADDSRPSTRLAGGLSARWIKAWRADLKSNLWIRGYRDDWGIDGLTVEGKLHWDFNEQWRISPVLRLNKQGAADFYRSFQDSTNTFAATGPGSNDARLGAFNAVTAQLHTEYHASKQWTFNAGLNHYRQSTGLKATWLNAGFSLKY